MLPLDRFKPLAAAKPCSLIAPEEEEDASTTPPASFGAHGEPRINAPALHEDVATPACSSIPPLPATLRATLTTPAEPHLYINLPPPDSPDALSNDLPPTQLSYPTPSRDSNSVPGSEEGDVDVAASSLEVASVNATAAAPAPAAANAPYLPPKDAECIDTEP